MARADLTTAVAGLLGLAHFAVDGACVTAMMGLALSAQRGGLEPWQVVLAYNFLAFATQPLLGWALDRCGALRAGGVTGCVMVAAGALLWPVAPRAALVLCGLGNALFHVGAGGLVLRSSGGSAALPGLFVAPGDLGVLIGVVTGDGGHAPVAQAFALAALAAVVPLATAPEPEPTPVSAPRDGGLVVVPLLLAVFLRGWVGSWMAATDPALGVMTLALLSVAFVAKAAGGIAADRWGWRPVAVGAAAAALLLAAEAHGGGLLAAMVLVQAPMGVTLAALGRAHPRRPAYTFGLTTLCLYLGGPPLGPKLLSFGVPVAVVQAVCAASLAWALRPPVDATTTSAE